MVQRSNPNDAAAKDAQIKLRKEEYVLSTGRKRLREKLSERSIDMNVLLMDAQIKSSREEYALNMGQRLN
jgi:hypothetical protein